MAETQDKVIFGGRLAEYKYYDMHQAFESAINAAKKRTTLTILMIVCKH